MLDAHTHILPGMDDGSRDLKQSIAMLRIEKSQEIDQILLTPHYYANRESPRQFLSRRAESLVLLENETTGQQKMPRWHVGAEVAFFSGMSRSEEIEALCIGKTQAMLIEMPFGQWNRNMLDEIDYLYKCRGIRPIIAHVERYLRWQSRDMLSILQESGAWIQTNASFFLHWQTVRRALHMLRNGDIHFIGSDCHNTKDRPPNMDETLFVVESRLGEDALEHLERMETRLLEGE